MAVKKVADKIEREKHFPFIGQKVPTFLQERSIGNEAKYVDWSS
jgi:hypothetical protein